MRELLPVVIKFLLFGEGENDDQALINPPPLTHGDLRASVIQLDQIVTIQAQAMTAQANWEIVRRAHQQVATMASRIRDIIRMNPPTFYGPKVEEDPQGFIDEVYKKIMGMGLSTSEKDELSTYQLKDLDEALYVQWRDNRTLRGGPVTWENFKKAFLDRLFPREMRKVKVVEFIDIHQRVMSFHEYSLKFTKLSKYAPSLIFDRRY